MTEILLSLTAGLVLFLYAVSSLSETLQNALADKMSRLIKKFTANTFSSLLVGAVVTTLLDSSSAVIILTIILVNSKAMTFRQAMGIVLGANIGTTVSSQIIALDVGKYASVFLLIGFVLFLASKSARFNTLGKVILYFGVLFFGLMTMENAVEPLKEKSFFMEWMIRAEKPVSGALLGAFATLIIQSSSATVGMAIILAKKGLLGLHGGIAIMLGAELGTCSDTLLATIKGSRQALKTGLFHLLFNLVSIILGLLFFDAFCGMVQFVSSAASIEQSIANAHMLFNITGVFLFIWTIPLFEKVLNRLLPDKVA